MEVEVLREERIDKYLAEELGISRSTVKKMIDEAVAGYNKVAVSRAQEIRKWHLMERDLSVGHGELTATLKLKRNVVHQHYEKEIDSLYV